MAKPPSAQPLPDRGSKLSLGFGLVNVPVRMKPLAETQRPVPGKGMCPVHGPQLSQQFACCVGTGDEHVLLAGEKQTGYPHPDRPNEYVIVEPSAVKQLEESRSGQAQIERMVDVATIDPGYFDKTYLLWPEAGQEAAFDLLAAVLHQEGKAAVVSTVISKQTQTLVIRWSSEFECVLAHVLKFETQLRLADVTLVRNAGQARPEPGKEMVAAAKQLLATLAGDFDASEVADTYTPALQDLIRATGEGRTWAPPAQAEPAPVIDLLAALRESVAEKTAAKAKAKPRARKKVSA